MIMMADIYCALTMCHVHTNLSCAFSQVRTQTSAQSLALTLAGVLLFPAWTDSSVFVPLKLATHSSE